MGDAQYGRLFTERDMRAAISEAYRRGRAGQLAAWQAGFQADVFETIGPTFPADEPLFLLRARDAAAAATVRDYATNAVDVGAGREHIARVDVAEDAFEGWARAHPDRVKVPD